MAKPMTTSQMTDKQIDRACEIFRAKLTKHASEFSSETVQLAFSRPELSVEWLAVFRKRVKAIGPMIVRHAKVNRSKAPQKVLDATGRRQHTYKSVVKSMPQGEGEEKEVFFFKSGRHYVIGDDLAKEYKLRGLVPDPYAQAQVNADDPAFADTHPNASQWKDVDGKWCFAVFDLWHGKRELRVGHGDYDRSNNVWFAGVRK